MAPRDTLERIERYFDLVPRDSADVEEHGPLTVFVGRDGSQFYARPQLGGDPSQITRAAVQGVLERQRVLGVPLALEWVDSLAPDLAGTVATAGLSVHRHPLLVLDRARPAAPVAGVTVRVAAADDPALAAVRAAISVGFRAGGLQVGLEGAAERDAAVAGVSAAAVVGDRARIADGRTIVVLADSLDGPIGGGSARPRGAVAELTGIATLPAERCRGVGVGVTAALAQELHRRGITTIFMSATDDDVARIYERAGFRRIGIACVAESS